MLLSALTETRRDVPVAGITADSRQVRDGYLFAALPGNRQDGTAFIADAIAHGAKVILAPEGTILTGYDDVVLLTDENPRRALARLAARFYGQQPRFIAAVTGTSGKTSTVSFTQQLWELAGIPHSASLGTLGIRAPGMNRYGSLTTPDTVSLHAQLADLAAAGITHLAMEASSHGLDQYRLDGVHVNAAAYTNLSRDHLDYHTDMDDYFAAKARLFNNLLPDSGTAVIHTDDMYGRVLFDLCNRRGMRILRFGAGEVEIALQSRVPHPAGQDITLRVLGEKFTLRLPLVGDFQVQNAMAALGLVLAEGRKAGDIVPLLAQLQGVPGRLQLVPGHKKDAAVYVDYAHKPAALETVLKTLRPHTRGRLVCLVGCGGDRDAGKRPIMGHIAATLADAAIITDDNPRSEDPAAIRAAMMADAPGAIDIGGRRDAIRHAVAMLDDGDVLVVAGKGHEQGQIIGDEVLPFDDVDEVKSAMECV